MAVTSDVSHVMGQKTWRPCSRQPSCPGALLVELHTQMSAGNRRADQRLYKRANHGVCDQMLPHDGGPGGELAHRHPWKTTGFATNRGAATLGRFTHSVKRSSRGRALLPGGLVVAGDRAVIATGDVDYEAAAWELAECGPSWDQLVVGERCRLLVIGLTSDGRTDEQALRPRSAGIQVLALGRRAVGMTSMELGVPGWLGRAQRAQAASGLWSRSLREGDGKSAEAGGGPGGMPVRGEQEVLGRTSVGSGSSSLDTEEEDRGACSKGLHTAHEGTT